MIAEFSHLAVPVERLRRRVDPAHLPFASTADVEPLTGTIGQPRAVEAIEFGLDIEIDGYNLYVAGMPGSGRESTINDFLSEFAADRPTPSDWIYVHNFDQPDRPRAIELPAGMGQRFARDMQEFVEAARRDIPRAFDSEDYEQRHQDALAEIQRRRESLTRELQTFATERGFALQMTQTGIATVPISDGQPVPPEQFQQLPEEVRKQYEENNREIQRQISSTFREMRQLEKEAAERVRDLEREVALFAVGPHFQELQERYAEHPEVLDYLDEVQNDIPEHLADFRTDQQTQQTPLLPGMPQQQSRN
jgi:exonuclease VII large subunit